MPIHVDVLSNKLPGAALKARQRAGQISQESAKRIEADAQRRAPRRSGHLQDDSIHAIKVGAFTWIVFASTEDGEHDEYAHFVEYGTTQASAQPFLTPAAEAERSAYYGAFDHLLDGL